MDDTESIELLAKQDPTDNPTRITALGWTAERELLATIIDVLSEMHATLIQVNSEGAKRPSVDHVRRPVNVMERIERKQALADHEALVSKMMGGEANGRL